LDVIRRMDQLLASGAKGYETRQELIRDALEGYILELSYRPAPDEPTSQKASLRPPEQRPWAGPRPEQATEQGPPRGEALDLRPTVLHAPDPGFVIEGGIARVVDEPLFGLHNRDYPSLWAACFLATMTQDGPVPVDDFFSQVTREAWAYAEGLSRLENVSETKLTALFPKNPAKRQSAEGAFLLFAIGHFSGGDDGIKGSGPLFAWHICQLDRREDRLVTGLTPQGRELLERLDGLSLQLPHPQELAVRFLDHVRKWAPGDWSGFRQLLLEVGRRVTRPELVAAFARWRPDWTANEAATNAAGYVARAREWGLVELKQSDQRYALTPFGEEQLEVEKRK